MTVGGFAFVWGFAYITDPDKCDTFEHMSEFTRNEIKELSEKVYNLETCNQYMPQIFDLADLNGDGQLERCEDAAISYSLGNTQDYSRKYSHRLNKSQIGQRCN